MARLLLLTNRIIDDRGRKTGWRSAWYISGIGANRHPDQSPWIDAYKRQLGRELIRRKPWIVMLVLLVICGIIGITSAVAYDPNDVGALIIGGGIGCGALYGVLLWAKSFWLDVKRDRAILSMLTPDCPNCEHALDGLPIADDGCTICPECGYAWDLREYLPPAD